jgi:hypothetical protein
VAEREASGEFDYLLGDRTDARQDVDVTSHDLTPPDEPVDQVWADEPAGPLNGSFNAFDETSWYFEPAPAPWYRTKQSLTALIATGAAAVALVVSGVLLAFQGSGGTVDESTSVTPTAPTSVASSAPSSSPAPPPPPPPPETSAEPAPPPAQTYQPRTPRVTKEPEIGVTRTPVTRSPLSVSPQRPGNRGTR